ncbi:hypothetical protein DICPUDRAFT_95641 [Dictyostelium purpureum]|uniref:Uncharacterized protein n=1 Tax=Dictyostelium purpureum TaxID=5786 RepID=F0ZYS2_DICPU|nr:uncharacterized protein DICPUDRAFT_95641 [Dictyostelium purpureum]EGC30893.1 hypothetical protein DICPUDRAFT_95641 [Dictyostelium purpureum]|eukprot:XP_003292566.1 hypothetical protein DICPUDRAFT_95641 [Dictyostelium purpureum]
METDNKNNFLINKTKININNCGDSTPKQNNNDQLKKKYPSLHHYFPNTSDLLVKKICSWVIDDQKSCRGVSKPEKSLSKNMEAGVYEILEIVLNYITQDLKESEVFLVISVYFANKYVEKVGIRQSQILWLILISCILSLKMFSDSNKINLDIIEKRFLIDAKHIGKMEIQFLSNIDYNLYLEESSITAFLTCIFIDYKINCQSKLDMIQNLFSQIESIKTGSE